MNWEQGMLDAISNQNNSLTQLQISQSTSANIVSEQLQAIYSSQEAEQSQYLQLLQALNSFTATMGKDSLHDFFTSYQADNSEGDSDWTVDGAQSFMDDFNKEFSQYGVTISNTKEPNFDSNQKRFYDSSSDWQITFTVDGTQQQISGSDSQSLSNAVSEIEDAKDKANTTSQNDTQTIQAAENDLVSGFQSSSQAASNIISTGNTLAQTIGFTSSLLAQPM